MGVKPWVAVFGHTAVNVNLADENFFGVEAVPGPKLDFGQTESWRPGYFKKAGAQENQRRWRRPQAISGLLNLLPVGTPV